tara:strand:+ start:443 stop:643 length:201 start_codon:yes stop_codon:yes gene_type:complete
MKNVPIDTGDIETTLQNGGRVTVKSLAEKHNVSPLIIRNLLNSIYGSRITYIRGRNGGICITPQTS